MYFPYEGSVLKKIYPPVQLSAWLVGYMLVADNVCKKRYFLDFGY